jgi:hypothetical protein
MMVMELDVHELFIHPLPVQLRNSHDLLPREMHLEQSSEHERQWGTQ